MEKTVQNNKIIKDFVLGKRKLFCVKQNAPATQNAGYDSIHSSFAVLLYCSDNFR